MLLSKHRFSKKNMTREEPGIKNEESRKEAVLDSGFSMEMS
jgi:hypothetical protein